MLKGGVDTELLLLLLFEVTKPAESTMFEARRLEYMNDEQECYDDDYRNSLLVY